MTQIPPILVNFEGTGVRAGPFYPLDGLPVVTGVRNGAEGINVATFFLMRGPLCRYNDFAPIDIRGYKQVEGISKNQY